MTTDGLVVRPWCVDDAAATAAMYALDRDGIMAAEPWREPAFFTSQGQLDRARVWAQHGDLPFVAVQNGQLVGDLILEDATGESATVGYFVSPARRNLGVAARALGLLIQIAFDELGIQTLVAEIRPDNAASRRVAERNGFSYVEPVTLDGVELDRFVLRSGQTLLL
ncbi:MAG TPA: GNAT family protein [Acidimicrobiia bacterium]|nr:GNAT family protein [Acidimicrobiia bacterium]